MVTFNQTEHLALLRSIENAPDFGDKALHFIVNKIVETTGIESCSIMKLEDDLLKIKAAKGLADHIIKSTSLGLGEGISGWVAKQASPLLVKDVGTHSIFRVQKKWGERAYKTNSLLCLPIIYENKVIGVLNLTDKSTGQHFIKEDLMFFTEVTKKIAEVLK